jgi:hypothetical protein
MNEKPDGNERSLRGLKVPGPPEELRQQVLKRARQALENEPRHDLWARIWDSREARLAWAASVLVLAVCHFALPWGAGGPAGAGDRASVTGHPGAAGPVRGRSAIAWTSPGDFGELSVIIDLPRLIFDDRTIAGSAPVLREAEQDLDSAAPPAKSEENAS